MSNSNIGNKQPSLRKPVVLMTMGSQERKGHDYQVMTHKYITPLVDFADCVPVLVPTCCGIEDLETYLDMADGVYLTGAGSNIEPSLYGQENQTPGKGQDVNRDLFDIPLVKAALKRGLPIFGICRGMQEINVALGGDIYQKVYAEPGFNDHRENPEDPVDVQYAQVHGVKIKPGSWLRETLGTDEIRVNSLHGQGLRNLGAGIEPIAHAEDGLVEAIHAPSISPFLFAVQWHPEWQAAKNPDSIKIFQAFGDACRAQVRKSQIKRQQAA
ncbi:TPA: gamma-glutamyl-gamma-aminobutyrate hydrolase family protein [Pseudomonas putida]|jgi:putative glutamine amidotransferase|uniref:gamma-glutamyl-gamma-aminobutyrate hydrolase family protein n=1 Tax=Pseudomonas TaxID=286 RepID=UPI00048894D7|nr:MULTISPECIES: type 1 glutamine amidotransferase [Pseudomonas]MDD2152612.1 gamma-glutamyl-gamma-aminobutyrate hydrolase family protein [Pseudomonas putida]RAS21645.1 gamma-glutamyl-gamma-aminobutyrate hydrolase [Pseudomonas sp. URMO17WK12:I7]SMF65426.1 gamma-glutamyl-gamma-aminobutyrate hydrolase [Pseudomonas sp. URMO17WK12:I5]HDS1679460.1 gamma-glutamyl-gamma-aminobutyrate hydrolase family protein [Pseudomonas putida]